MTISLPIARPHKLRVIYVPYDIFVEKERNQFEKNPCKVYSIAVDKETVAVMEEKVLELIHKDESEEE